MIYSKELSRIKDKLINSAIFGATIFIIPSLIGSFLRFYEYGWLNIFFLHIFVSFAVLGLLLFRNKVSIQLKIHAFAFIFILIAVAGLINFKLLGGWYFVLVVVSVVTITLGRKAGFVYVLITSILFGLIAFLYQKNYISNTIDYNAYINSKFTWINHFLGTTLGSLVLVYIGSEFYKLFTNTILNLSNKSQELNNTLSKLQYSEDRFRTFTDRFPFPITIKDSNLKYVYSNKAVETIRLNKYHNIHGLSTIDVFPIEVTRTIEEFDRKVLNDNDFAVFDICVDVEEAKQYYRLIKFPIKDISNEKLVGTIAISTTEQKVAEHMLVVSEKKYRTLFEGSIDGFALTNSIGEIIDCNSSFANLINYTKAEIFNKSFFEFTPKEYHKKELELITNGFADGKKYSGVYEKEFIHKSGNRVPVEINVYKLNIDNEDYFGAIIHDISERKEVEQKVYKAMVESEETERERYAKELHDGLGPLLSTSMIYMNALNSMAEKEKRNEYVKRGLQLLAEAVQNIKDISNNLSPMVLRNYGLGQALQSFIDKLTSVTDISFSLNSNLEIRLSELVEITLYRTVIELINNSVKYSKANNVSIQINHGEEQFVILYSDNGVGFDYEKVKAMGKGFGLLNLENRIHKIGGKYDFQSTPNKGVSVIILVNNICL